MYQQTVQDWEQRCEVTSRLAKAWDAEGAAISNREQGSNLLTAIFETLSDFGRAVEIALANTGSTDWFYMHDDTVIYGVHQLHQSLGGDAVVKRKDNVPGDCKATTVTLLTALAGSRLLVGKLALCYSNRNNGLALDAFAISNSAWKDLFGLFSRLSVLRIGLSYGYEYRAGRTSYSEKFDQVLRAAMNLNGLHLNWIRIYNLETEKYGIALFGRIKPAVRSNHLQTFNVCEMSLHEGDLKNFLTTHFGTLRSISWEYVAICGWDS